MIDPHDIEARAEALSAALKHKLGVRGATLSVRLGRAGRALPNRVRRAGKVIVAAQRDAAHPRLAMMADRAPVDAAFAEINAFLKGINRSERRMTRLLGWLGGVVLNLLVLAVLLVLALRWQGYL